MMKYTSMDRIFSKVVRDLGPDIQENDLIEWAGEALDAINAVRDKEEAIAFLPVANWTAELPYNLHNIIQIAKNTQVDDPHKCVPQPAQDDEELYKEPETDHPVCIDCNGVPYNEYSVAYYRPFTDHQFEYYGWMGRPIYQRMYEPVRLTNHSFFHTLTCQETDYDNIYNNCNWEYTVREGKYLKFNFERGMVALSYLRSITDEKGYPMIPDDYTFLTAITAYITLRHMKRKMYTEAKRENITMAQSAQADWDKYVRMAVNKALSPQGIDEYENLKDQRLYLIPRRNAYQNFFGNLNRKEIKNTMHTESRNNAGRVFRRFPV